MADERAAYPDSSRRSEQLSCTKYFHLTYGLFYINFQKKFKQGAGDVVGEAGDGRGRANRRRRPAVQDVEDEIDGGESVRLRSI